ncbi:hypothetical protein RSJ42_06995 [Methanosarcina hadiensis]|uniref:hypothetical protein n=1 Tax=Methanosarcina hadiensis TaxID=3078083 RepID=UPI003977B54B
MLGKYCKLLLGVYILKKLNSGNSHEVTEISEHKKSGLISKYSKLILGAYLMRRLKTGRYYGTRVHEESTGGLLHRYGSLMLTTYAAKKLRAKKSHKETEQLQDVKQPAHGSSFLPHAAMRLGKWLLGVYLLKKFHHKEPESEIEEIVETETYEEDKGSSLINLNKVIVGALVGVTAMYAVKKYRANHNNGYDLCIE